MATILPVLEVSGLSKRYGDREAVRSLSFHVSPGEIFGLLGPNGAGKTTTIGMIAGVVASGGGSIRVAGEDASSCRRKALRKLGLVPQSIALYPALTARENLAFFGSIYGLSRTMLTPRIDSLLELAGLGGRRDEAIAAFSGGMKRRLNLACALVHEPALVLLDEPTVGVDPQSRERIYEAMQELAANGLALLLTTHYLEEAERLCHRLAIMDEGRIVAEGSVKELCAVAGKEPTVEVVLSRVPGDELRRKLSELGAWVGEPTSYRILGAGAEKLLPELLALVGSEGNDVQELRMHRPNLGDAFLHLTGKALRD
jgi:linearmycin/streptolysin S transport system ATP-binding protein